MVKGIPAADWLLQLCDVTGKPFVGRSAALCCDDALSKSVCHESVLKVSLVRTLTACMDPCQMVYG